MRAQLGKPYEWAGNGPSSFDCSGLTVWAFRSVGIALPRTTYGQVGMGVPVDRASIQPGDLVFFDTDGSGPSHVGIATSATTVISATATSGVVEHTMHRPLLGRALRDGAARRLTLEQRQRERRAQRPAVGGEHVQLLLHRRDAAVEVEAAPAEHDARAARRARRRAR